MKIIVCVKQVPDTAGKVAVKPDGTLDRASMPVITNPDDMAAMEAALTLKEETGAKVVAVSMGPMSAEEMLRELLAMGADDAVLISGREFGGSDTYATSQVLAAGIRKIGLEEGDVVFCGRQAIDGDTAQVGPQIAEKLGLPQVTYVAGVTMEDGVLTCQRLLEDGREIIQVKTPCLLTCVKELKEPRYMNIKGIYDACRREIAVLDYPALEPDPLIDSTTIGLKGSPTNIFKSFTPPVKSGGMMLEGTVPAVCRELAERLAAKHII